MIEISNIVKNYHKASVLNGYSDQVMAIDIASETPCIGIQFTNNTVKAIGENNFKDPMCIRTKNDVWFWEFLEEKLLIQTEWDK